MPKDCFPDTKVFGFSEAKKRHKSLKEVSLWLAGAVRFELTTKVLETHVLPLHHAPMFREQKDYTSEQRLCQ